MRPGAGAGWSPSAGFRTAGAEGEQLPQGPAHPAGAAASRRCTPGSRPSRRSRSTPSSPTWTPSPASTSPAAACTRCRWPGRGGAEARRGHPLRHHRHPGDGGARPGHRACSPPTGSACPPTSWCSTPTCRWPTATCSPPTPRRAGSARHSRLDYSPSCFLMHVGSSATYSKTAHHNIHFGKTWAGVFRELIKDQTLMSDPSILVTNHSHSDPTQAPAGQADLLRARADAAHRSGHRLVGGGAAVPRRARGPARGARVRRVRRRDRGRAPRHPGRLGGPGDGDGRAVRERALVQPDRPVPARQPHPPAAERGLHRLGHPARAWACRWCSSPAGSPPSGSPGGTAPTGPGRCRWPAEARPRAAGPAPAQSVLRSRTTNRPARDAQSRAASVRSSREGLAVGLGQPDRVVPHQQPPPRCQVAERLGQGVPVPPGPAGQGERAAHLVQHRALVPRSAQVRELPAGVVRRRRPARAGRPRRSSRARRRAPARPARRRGSGSLEHLPERVVVVVGVEPAAVATGHDPPRARGPTTRA